jgi:VWFA-related protein
MTRPIALTAALVASIVAMPLAQQATFRARIDIVRVDALVTNNRKPVLGLKASDFEITDNGVRQQIDLVSADEIPIIATMALDTSASLDGPRLEQLRSAGSALLRALKSDDQSALVTFSHALDLGSKPTTDHTSVLGVLDNVGAEGRTSLYDATYAGLALSVSDTARSMLLVFSDGFDTSSWLTPDAVMDTAKRSQAVVYGVAVRGRIKNPFLDSIADLTGGALIQVESTKNLDAVFLQILDEFRHRYLISYRPRGVTAAGWHKLEVKAKGGTVRARQGYIGG